MKTWTRDIEIHAPIDQVWKLLDGTLEDMQKIMPNVVENTLVKGTENAVGAVYRQKYREGKRMQGYDVETIEYENEADFKKLKVTFTLANMFEITTSYEAKKLEDHKTYFRYTTTNNPLKWFTKLLLKLVNSDKVVVQFVERVKQVAEEEVRKR
ncbi:SRPBCC family protein [Ornithinibacillus massiliensis]|uniref:SRPBCC family protein n=1 Tax=Ornithinibacillus massiliensis TaxID=1944633 RepID=A0ABS5MGI1_9BACI|nr:SRPBCC family protein [Ornithinibacillus massiliensis]MBS3681447.1 SRPBCC family protein [Ornithinibacillus massiliensis]